MTDSEKIVQAQLDAYNNRDIDAFVACFSEDVQVLTFPDNQLKENSSGKNFRAGYEKMFAELTNLHCKVVNRCVHGNIVVDQEEVTGLTDPTKILKALAIYEVTDGIITKVWFAK